MTVIRRAIILSSGERYVIVLLNLLQTAVASRLLSAEEFGLVALGLAVTQVLEPIRDLGSFNYLVQKDRLTEEVGRTAFTVPLVGAVLIAALLSASSGLIASRLDQADLRDFLLVMALSVVVTPFSAPVLAIMRREFEFGSLMAVNCCASVVQTLALLWLAWTGWGAMCFAWAMVASGLASVVACLILRPDLQWLYAPSLSDWRDALSFGWISGFAALINRAYDLLPVFLLSRMLPLEVVGLYNRAMLVSQLPDRILFASVSGVVLPTLARGAREGRCLKEAYLAGLGLISVVQWPALILIAALAEPLIVLLLGPAWLPCAPIVQIVALASLSYFPALLSYPTLVASGGVRDTLTSSFIHLPIGAAIIVAGSPWGLMGVVVGQCLAMPLLILVDMIYIRRRISFTVGELLGALRKSAIVTACSAMAPIALACWTGGGRDVGLPLAIMIVICAGFGWIVGAAAVRHPIYEQILGMIQFGRLTASRAMAD